MPDFINCTVRLKGQAPMSQSRWHGEPRLEGEGEDAYDERTWPHKMTTVDVAGRPAMAAPAMAFQRGLIEGAKFSKKQIQGQGRSTWTKRFEAGVMVPENGVVTRDGKPVWADEVTAIMLPLNADGVRGGGKRVMKRLPQIPAGWNVTFPVIILDAMITQDVFHEMAETTGMFIGLGQFRPQQGGNNGRFVIDRLEWEDNRMKVPARSRK